MITNPAGLLRPRHFPAIFCRWSRITLRWRTGTCKVNDVLHLVTVYEVYTPTQRGHSHHGMFHNPTSAVNLFQVGKQYLTF